MEIKKGIIEDNGLTLQTLVVELKNTSLIIIEGYNSFAMCGALDTEVYNSLKFKDKPVICFKAVGVKSVEELYNATIKDCSIYAKEKGIHIGMKVFEAFKYLSRE